jgi:uncharacterized protein (UPF0276 family)
MVALGFALQPDADFLERTAGLCERDVDYFEVAPETLWYKDAAGRLWPNAFHRRFAALRARTRRPFVAHGVGFSLSSDAPADRPRKRAWLDRLREDHATFDFRWYTDHLGATAPDATSMALPLPMPMDAYTARVVRRNLRALQRLVPDVGAENTANYFTLGDPLDEPRWLREALGAAESRRWLLLDLHNVWTMAQNAGFDPDAWIARAPLERVIEIHVSGGELSDPGWLPNGRVMRLDGHSSAVPEEVFALLERVLPRCPHVRGVTLERMEGTVGPGDAALLREELRRVRRIVTDRTPSPDTPAKASRRAPEEQRRGRSGRGRTERWIARAMTSSDPALCLARASRDPRLSAAERRALQAADPDGVRISALLVARLRFERLVQGSAGSSAWFERDPGSFVAAFRAYHSTVVPRSFFPQEEARAFDAWRLSWEREAELC